MQIKICPPKNWARIFILLLSVFLAAKNSSASGTEKQILLLNSYHWGMSWSDAQVAGFRTELKEAGNKTTIFTDQMDVLNQHAPYDDDFYLKYLNWRYSDRQFDLIVANDNAALSFIARHYDTKLFKGKPVVFSDVHTIEQITIPHDMRLTGVIEHHDFRAGVEIAQNLRPNAGKIVVFGNKAKTGSGPSAALQFLSTWQGDVPPELHIDKTLEEIIEIASNTPPEDIIFSLARAKNDKGYSQSYGEVRAAIAKVSLAPVFTFWSGDTQYGSALGGEMNDPINQGREAAKLAMRVLDGEDPSTIPYSKAKTQYGFHYPTMKRLGIEISDLPAGSTLYQKPVSIYEEYKREFWSGILTVFLLLLIIGVLLKNINVRKAAERALAASKDQLEDEVKIRTSELVSSNKSLNNTLNDLKLAQNQLVESEKMAALGGLVSGIAHEINTPIGVSLTAASHLGDTTGTMISSYKKDDLSRERFEKFLSDANQTATMLISNLMRAASLISNFKQVAVDQSSEISRDIDLKEYIETTAMSLEPELKKGAHTIDIECNTGIGITTYPGLIAQVITNLVINSVKHGFGEDHKNGSIRIKATDAEEQINIYYQDNGKGMPDDVLKNAFDPFFTTSRGQGGSGLGLSIVYNLVTHKLQGMVTCDSRLGAGTEFTITFPKQTASR